MISLDDKSEAKEDFCLSEKLPPLHVIFPLESWPANPPAWPSQRKRGRKAQPKIVSIDRESRPISPNQTGVKLDDQIELNANPDESIQTAEPKTLSPAELHRLYSGTSVPRHRYLASALSEAVSSPELAPYPEKWLAGVSGIDLPGVVSAWMNTNRSTEYEQLYCIGLDPDSGQLTGMLKVKRGSGYSGGPRTAGSTEYVAFWVDWGSGFHYEGTASAVVHDFGWLPPAGLEYSVSLPVDFLSRIEPRSEGSKTVKVRAVLCWNTPPSTADPNAPVVWGNIVESRIPIPLRHEARAGNRVPGLAMDAEDGGATFALVAWKRGNIDTGAASNMDCSLVGFCPQAES